MSDFNLLQTNSFTFNLLRSKETTFRVTSCSVPAVSVPPAEDGYGGGTQYFPGTFNEFDPVTLRFIVDEDLKNYEEIYRWITQQRYAIGSDYIPKDESDKLLVSDGVLTTLTNNSRPNRAFYFKDMFPVELGSIDFDTTSGTTEPVTCSVTFRYSYFTLK